MKHDGISRRDFLNGVSLGIAGTIAPIDFLKSQGIDIDYYPPVLTGIRGNHPGSFNAAHKLAFTGSGFIDEVQDLGESYDLIILERNLYDIPIEEISEVRVLETIIEGKTVYRTE